MRKDQRMLPMQSERIVVAHLQRYVFLAIAFSCVVMMTLAESIVNAQSPILGPDREPPVPVVPADVEIWLKWENLSDVLGFPIMDSPAPTADGLGLYLDCEWGSIYWKAETGTQEVHGAIRTTWAFYGWEGGILGYPLTDELSTPDGIGRYNHFEHGSIYWNPLHSTGSAFRVSGVIRDKWASMGWERSILRYPIRNLAATRDTIGRYQDFEGGSIYWSPSTGAHEIHGVIRDKWISLGSEQSSLGYPITDEKVFPDPSTGHPPAIYSQGFEKNGGAIIYEPGKSPTVSFYSERPKPDPPPPPMVPVYVSPGHGYFSRDPYTGAFILPPDGSRPNMPMEALGQ